MRTRRSRFFVILLHVVGVSHSSFYHWNSDNSSDQNNNASSSLSSASRHLVEPNSIALEYIDFYEELLLINDNQNYMNNNHNSNTRPKWKFWKSFRRRKAHNEDSSATATAASVTPIWLQDPVDGLCLGPMSTFSECGDATLWFVTIQYDLPPSNKLELLSGIPPTAVPSIDHHSSSVITTTTSKQHSNSNHSSSTKFNATTAATVQIRQPTNTRIGITFRVVDQDFVMSGTTTTRKNTNHPTQLHRRRRQHEPSDAAAECLDADINHLSVHVRQCRCRGGYIWQRKSAVRSSVWTVNTNGILQPFETMGTTTAATNAKRKRTDSNPKETKHVLLCLTRNSTRAILANCETHNPIQFLFLRYHTVPTTNSKDRRKRKQHNGEDGKPQQPHQQPQYYGSSTSDASPTITTPQENPDEKKASVYSISTMHRDRT